MIRRSVTCLLVGTLLLATLLLSFPALCASETSQEAQQYLSAVLDIMQQHAIHRDSIDWVRLRAQAHARAAGAQSPSDTYEAIRLALRSLQDYHSMFIVPADAAALRNADLSSDALPEGRMLTGSVALVTVPAFAGSAEAGVAYATALHGIICSLAGQGAVGWVVDLRGNTGGDMWAMLAGLGPILGTDICGAFVSSDGEREAWSYGAGAALQDGVAQTTVADGHVCPSLEPLPPVAVLFDRSTISSGEAMAVAFVGREAARSFGQATAGLTTANQDFTLSDGAILLLTVSTFADRNGMTYGSVIVPDKHVSVYSSSADGVDAVLTAALAWLCDLLAL